ncbi:uncharacterized protein BKCO1_1000160 [Diplodia corticola]|uniref:DUF1763-domain-containing protein n=1 Tax=Diplodia corticola TaxID=236234 RepID=A0A1J9SLG5_9PEZI|nr:uncharacterized protein BKCO1_1000160 [Diplodia corticola]OJD40556.1 hypothetical protein BKCO1_1000160 [Diplodia corticola]
MPATDREILRAYRHLYSWGLRAVQYSKPARFTLRDRLRRIFRTNDRAAFDQRRIDNTLEFLRGATRERGLEHRLVKRLIHVWWLEDCWKSNTRYLNTWKSGRRRDEIRIARTLYDPFNHKIRMLNETMGMCIQ